MYQLYSAHSIQLHMHWDEKCHMNNSGLYIRVRKSCLGQLQLICQLHCCSCNLLNNNATTNSMITNIKYIVGSCNLSQLCTHTHAVYNQTNKEIYPCIMWLI